MIPNANTWWRLYQHLKFQGKLELNGIINKYACTLVAFWNTINFIYILQETDDERGYVVCKMIDQDFMDFNHIDGFLSFLWSIDWRDPWLIGLLTFHVTIFMMAVLTRNYGNFQALLFFILLLLVYFSESINEIASTNWHLFSKQQYFDSKGLFISVVFSMPILLNCILMVGSWLYQSTQLMKNLKTAQLQERIKRQKRASLKDRRKSD